MALVVHSSKDLRQLESGVSGFIVAAEAYRDSGKNVDLKATVAEAAGKCWKVAEITDTLQVYTAPPAVGGKSLVYDPITSWDAEIDPFLDQLTVAIDAAYQARGVLHAMADQADQEERTLVGRVARFVGFPGRVRKHLADRDYPVATQRVGFVTSIFVQIVAVVAGGLILAWVVLQLGWN